MMVKSEADEQKAGSNMEFEEGEQEADDSIEFEEGKQKQIVIWNPTKASKRQ